jgi:hypothetical protein
VHVIKAFATELSRQVQPTPISPADAQRIAMFGFHARDSRDRDGVAPVAFWGVGVLMIKEAERGRHRDPGTAMGAILTRLQRVAR